jgi:acyl-CoA reductase-like NAD-dependent aldehyde dehydrogenase
VAQAADRQQDARWGRDVADDGAGERGGHDRGGAPAAVRAAWGQSAPRERSEILRRAFEALMDRRDELALVMTMETGKPLAEARGEIEPRGVKASGLGREGGRIGIDEFLEVKYVGLPRP